MATTTATAGYGTIIARNGVNVAEVTSITGPNFSTNIIDATHMESPNATVEVLAGLKNAGEITLEVNFLPGTAAQSDLLTSDWTNRTLQTFTITWSDTAPTVYSFSAYVTGFVPSAPVEDKMSATITLTISGVVTIT